MKKLIALCFAALLLLSVLPMAAFAVDASELPHLTSTSVAYLDYGGADANTGNSPSAAKKTFGSALNLLKKGGALVASGKAYLAKDYTFPQTTTPLLFTSTYGGVSYAKATPQNNPDCAFKMAKGCSLTIRSDVIFDNIIVFQEAAQNSIIVEDGGTLVIGSGVVNMTKQSYQMKIVVESGGTLVLGGGDFVIENNGGKIIENYTYAYSEIKETAAPVETKPEVKTDVPAGVAFIDYNNGNNANNGQSAATAKKQLLALDANGATSLLAGGGTLVVSGKLYLGADYTFPKLGSLLTITGVYDGKSYVDDTPIENPSGAAIKLASGKILTFATDARIDDVIFFQEGALQNEIVVAAGTTVTFGKNVVAMTKQSFGPALRVEKGGVAIFESDECPFDTLSGDGVILMRETADKTTVKLTIGKTTAYVNGVPKTLDSAPIIKDSRTLLPVRFIAESFGADVAWDGATSTATITADGISVKLTLGSKTAYVNGEAKALDVAPLIQNSRTLLPVRFIVESLGAEVAWDGATSTATIVK